jgi:hypothetical protein
VGKNKELRGIYVFLHVVRQEEAEVCNTVRGL